MQNFKITYGIGGGYNVTEVEIVEAANEEAAMKIAYGCAAEVFESYGVFENQNPDYDQNSEDYEADWLDELERWIDYSAEAV